MGSKKLSIIIPVFNVKNYLTDCLNNLIVKDINIKKQIEIILIDDGSTDGSDRLCNEYAKLYGYFKVIHQKNGGQSNARNNALKVAEGEWIVFIDSDDVVVENYVTVILDIIQHASDADLILFRYRSFIEDEKIKNISVKFDFKKIESISKATGMYYLTTVEWGNYFWNKIYKSKLFNNLYLPEGRKYEDIATLYKYLYRAKKIMIYNEVLYLYRQREGSTIHIDNKTTIEKLNLLRESIWARKNQIDFFEINNYKTAYNNAMHYLMTDEVFYIVWANKCGQTESTDYLTAKKFLKNYKPKWNEGKIFFVFIKAFNTFPHFIEFLLKNRK